MNPENDRLVSPWRTRSHSRSAPRSVIPPGPMVSPVVPLATYPSSALHEYYPPPNSSQNFAHIPTENFTHTFNVPNAFNLLPSASLSRLPSIRGTPSPIHSNRNSNNSYHSPQNIPLPLSHSSFSTLSPVAFHQFSPLPNIPIINQANNQFQPTSPLIRPNSQLSNNSNTRSFTSNHSHRLSLSQHHSNTPSNHSNVPLNLSNNSSNHSNGSLYHINNSSQRSSVSPYNTKINFTLPSTKDIPLLTGKHDWGPWHSVVRTLILHANVLGHIAEDPLPDAAYDPDLEPTYPPTIYRGSSSDEKAEFSEWWL